MTTHSPTQPMSLGDLQLAPLAPHRPSPAVAFLRVLCGLLFVGAAVVHAVVVFAPGLAVAELVIGVLILGKGLRARIGLLAGVGFHVVLAVMGFALYAVPAGFVLLTLLPYDFGAGLGRVRVHHRPEVLRPAA